MGKLGIKIWFEPDWDSRLRKAAEDQGLPIAELVRRAVVRYLQDPGTPDQPDPAIADGTPSEANPETVFVERRVPGQPSRVVPVTDMEESLRQLAERVAALEKAKDPQTQP